ncbi:NAD(P)-dependent oxidoreductase [Nocardioides sp. SYSU DS0663]|uniref:NAD(P)-dependent oxidoreductase n=1 Tax=Nocardioides sp. SYSU DS0663 TaxID=3416445 RepID=UPI003F4AFC7D
MRVLVIGASRGSGRETVRALRQAGHEVTALARTAAAVEEPVPAGGRGSVRRVAADVRDAASLEEAVAGQDAVVVTLGISDNALAVRLRRRAGTPLDIRSAGTRAVVAAMQRQGVRRLLVQTTYGIGDSHARLTPSLKLFFRLVLAPQVADSAVQEDVVRRSGLDWTLVRPVVLTDDAATGPAHVSDEDDVAGWKVSRGQVAGALVGALEDTATVGRTLSVSAG